jgi:hypothetical protein
VVLEVTSGEREGGAHALAAAEQALQRALPEGTVVVSHAGWSERDADAALKLVRGMLGESDIDGGKDAHAHSKLWRETNQVACRNIEGWGLVKDL